MEWDATELVDDSKSEFLLPIIRLLLPSITVPRTSKLENNVVWIRNSAASDNPTITNLEYNLINHLIVATLYKQSTSKYHLIADKTYSTTLFCCKRQLPFLQWFHDIFLVTLRNPNL